MNFLAIGLAGLLASLGTPAAATSPLEHALDPNPSLQSYVAKATLSAELHVGVPIHRTFGGTAYYRRPQGKIVFDNVSGPLSRFASLTDRVPTYSEVLAQYALRSSWDDGRASTFVLVPTARGRRVQRLTLTVDDDRLLVIHAAWAYAGGGRLEVDPSYRAIGRYALASQVNVRARFPGYSADGTLQLSGYRLNVPVAPDVFTD